MKRKSFVEYTVSLKNKLYNFAFILVGDDLQASQLVVDALTRLLVQQKDYWYELDDKLLDDKKEQLKIKRELMIDIASHIYSIGLKRIQQLPHQNQVDGFFKSISEPKTRAVAFLKWKWKLSHHELERCLAMSKVEVIEQVFQARYQLMKAKGFHQVGAQTLSAEFRQKEI